MKNIKYIINRILIGVGIVLLLGFIRGNLLIGVKAMEVSNYGIGKTEAIITNTTTNFVKSISGNPYSVWAGTNGYIKGTFALQKVDGSATSINVFPSQVYVNTSTVPNSFVCEVGSAMVGNSTFNGGTFTYKCPIKMGSSGVTALVFDFQDIQSNFPSSYRLTIGSLMTYEIVENASVNVDTSGTTNAVNNQTQTITNNNNQNTQNIINNQEQNTQDIINNQNSNTESTNNTIKEQFESCSDSSISNPTFYGVTIGNTSSGGYYYRSSDTNSGAVIDVSKYVGKDIVITYDNLNSSLNPRTNYCFASSPISDTSQDCLSGRVNTSAETNSSYNVTVPQNAKYLYFVGYIRNIDESWINNVTVTFPGLCTNRLDNNTDAINNVNDTITNDSVNTEQAGGFFENFQHDSHGLSGVITSPLRLINSLTTASCSPLEFNLPFVNNHVSLPCMKGIYQNYFGIFYSLWQLITTGLISYNVMINLYSKIHNLQNPNNDRIEVLNL